MTTTKLIFRKKRDSFWVGETVYYYSHHKYADKATVVGIHDVVVDKLYIINKLDYDKNEIRAHDFELYALEDKDLLERQLIHNIETIEDTLKKLTLSQD